MEYDLLPADIYKVINKSIITEQDLKILNMLYLPLIGPTALSLYNILVNDLDNLKQASPIISHAHLLSNLHISLKELLENVEADLEESKRRICELKEEVGDPIGTAEYVTDDDDIDLFDSVMILNHYLGRVSLY